MKLKTLAAVALAGTALLLHPHPAAQGKTDLLRGLQIARVALMLEQLDKPFTEKELGILKKALPTIKESNPKLYRDRKTTEKLLLLYMVLEEIAHAEKSGTGLKALAGKTRGQLAAQYVQRVYRAR